MKFHPSAETHYWSKHSFCLELVEGTYSIQGLLVTVRKENEILILGRIISLECKVAGSKSFYKIKVLESDSKQTWLEIKELFPCLDIEFLSTLG